MLAGPAAADGCAGGDVVLAGVAEAVGVGIFAKAEENEFPVAFHFEPKAGAYEVEGGNAVSSHRSGRGFMAGLLGKEIRRLLANSSALPRFGARWQAASWGMIRS